MGARQCKKGEHEADNPLFADPVLGGLIGWHCHCGALHEPTVGADAVKHHTEDFKRKKPASSPDMEWSMKRVSEWLAEALVMVACFGFVAFALVYCWLGQVMTPKDQT